DCVRADLPPAVLLTVVGRHGWSGFKSLLPDQLESVSANLALRSLNASLSFLAESQLRTRRRHARVHDRGAFAENGCVENAGIEKGAVADAGLFADRSRALVSFAIELLRVKRLVWNSLLDIFATAEIRYERFADRNPPASVIRVV